ncbi:mechanosensitive ion channel family protein [soil metagenome]
MSDIVKARWFLVALFGALVVVAILVNRFRPTERRMLRRAAILFVFAITVEVLLAIAHGLGSATWESRLGFASHLFAGFTAVNLGAVVVFDLILFAVGIELATIASDLAVGIGYVLVCAGALGTMGVNPTNVLGASAVVSAILELSLQSTLGNVIGGLALQLDGSIHVDDWIQLENGRQGKVREIRWRHTVLETRDWDRLIVPNATLLSSQITILGKREGKPIQHRMWIYFSVDHRHSPTRVLAVVNEALQSAPIPNAADDPKAHCILMDFASPGRDSVAYYAVRYWLTDLAVDDPTSSAVRIRLAAGLRRAQIPLALPAQTVFFAPGGDEEEGRKLTRHREKRRAALQGMKLFSALTAAEIESMVDSLKYAPFCGGEMITRQGNVAHWLYILTSGKVEIRFRLDKEPGEKEAASRVVATIDAPGVFGEMGLMTGEQRAADVIALNDAECYRLEKGAFDHIMKARPEIAAEMSRTLAERRVELAAAREDLDEDERARRMKVEEARIFGRIKEFFALDND